MGRWAYVRNTRLRPILIACSSCTPLASVAQEVEPRSYSPSPTGVTFFVAAYGRSANAALMLPHLRGDFAGTTPKG